MKTNINYLEKYIKYKQKYLNIGGSTLNDNCTDFICGLCLERHASDKIVVKLSSCSHILHYECICQLDLLQCPFCRIDILELIKLECENNKWQQTIKIKCNDKSTDKTIHNIEHSSENKINTIIYQLHKMLLDKKPTTQSSEEQKTFINKLKDHLNQKLPSLQKPTSNILLNINIKFLNTPIKAQNDSDDPYINNSLIYIYQCIYNMYLIIGGSMNLAHNSIQAYLFQILANFNTFQDFIKFCNSLNTETDMKKLKDILKDKHDKK